MDAEKTAAEFLETYGDLYGMLYDGKLRLSREIWDYAMARFDGIFEDEASAELAFLQRIVAFRGDAFSSDRECVAYAFAAGLV